MKTCDMCGETARMTMYVTQSITFAKLDDQGRIDFNTAKPWDVPEIVSQYLYLCNECTVDKAYERYSSVRYFVKEQ